MGRRNRKKETLERLSFKTLDAKFLREIQVGLNCSPFEAEAVLQVVKEVYFPFVDAETPSPPPGKITLLAVAADEPAGKSVAECEKQAVCLTLHRGPDDDRVFHEHGPAAFRQGRIVDLCQEALSQGGLLTAEDLAYRVFFVSPRTITRDLTALRGQDPPAMIPLRSTVHDIGPVLTHRTEIVRLALEGKTTTQICRILRHSPQAVGNYLATFTRCAQLAHRDMQAGQIAFLLRRGRGLIQKYLDLLAACESDNNMAYHLEELLRLGTAGGGKKASPGGGAMAKVTDRLRKRFGPLRDKTLENALAHRIGTQFPNIGGPRIRQLCAAMILEVVAAHLRPREHVRHGQVVWMAVHRDHPPRRGQGIAETELAPVVLDVFAGEDLDAILDRRPAPDRLLAKLLRLCRQAYEQNGLLSNCDLAALLNVDDSRIGRLLSAHERQTGQVVPRRATLHDVGSGLTHKRIICLKRFAEGKATEQIAQETHHSQEAVDHYLSQYDRVRCCRREGMTPEETAYLLDCGLSLVQEYLRIDRELEGEDA